MSTQSNATSESFQSKSAAPAVIPSTRVFYWSVRRELWEYRSIYLAPLAVAGVALVAFCVR
jgi:ABC-2 type transport system permease protein